MAINKKTNNIEDYLAWCGDIPLSVDPFNEIDNLVLCELGYAGLGGIVPQDGTITIREIRDRYFALHSRKKLQRRALFNAKAGLMLDAMANGARFSGMSVGNYVGVVDDDASAQMEAMMFLPEDETAYICFCGTDDTVAGWKENFEFGFLEETEGQRLAVQYLTKTAALTDRPLRVGGHSKGGNFAVFSAAFTDRPVQERIIEVYANDAPGFQEEVLHRDGYLRIEPKVISFIPETAIIGQLLSHGYQDIVVKSCENGLLQHDGFTWCIAPAGFVRAELSNTSRFIEQVLNEWLAKMDDSVRASFVDSLFAPIEAAKYRSFHEMLAQGWVAAEKIITTISAMPQEQQQSMRSAILELLQSGEDIALKRILEMVLIELN